MNFVGKQKVEKGFSWFGMFDKWCFRQKKTNREGLGHGLRLQPISVTTARLRSEVLTWTHHTRNLIEVKADIEFKSSFPGYPLAEIILRWLHTCWWTNFTIYPFDFIVRSTLWKVVSRLLKIVLCLLKFLNYCQNEASVDVIRLWVWFKQIFVSGIISMASNHS